MSIFSDIMDIVATANNSVFGDAAIMNRNGAGEDIPCQVTVEFEVEIQPDGYETEYMERVTTLEAMVSEVGVVKRDDTFAVTGNDTYTVRRVLSNNGQFIRVIVDVV